MSEFVKAYDSITGQKVVVPAHFLAKRSPFPNLKKLPSEQGSAAKKSRQPSGESTAEALAAAATDKEK